MADDSRIRNHASEAQPTLLVLLPLTALIVLTISASPLATAKPKPKPAALTPVPAADRPCRRPLAFAVLTRARLPTQRLADTRLPADVTLQAQDLKKLRTRLRAGLPAQGVDDAERALLVRLRAEAKTPWALAFLAELEWDVAAAEQIHNEATMPPQGAELGLVLAPVLDACARGLALAGKGEAAVYLHYLAGVAHDELGETAAALTDWQHALQGAAGRLAAELRFRRGAALLGSDDAAAVAVWQGVDDPQLRTVATNLELSWFAGQRFGCGQAVSAAVRLLQSQVPAGQPGEVTTADRTAAEEALTACLADPLEAIAETALPQDLPNREALVAKARQVREGAGWTASKVALELLRRCNELESVPMASELTLSGTLAKLKVQSKGKVSASLRTCVVSRASRIAVPGNVDARTLIGR